MTEALKILIASTPKTGNTWLRHLLAAVYDLPMVDVAHTFDPAEFNQLGERWITHQHYTPDQVLLDWTEQHGVVLVTTLRHPGDALVSLYHHVRNYRDRYDPAGFADMALLAQDDGSFGEPVRQFVLSRYHEVIGISAAWVRAGRSHLVRYEDLWYDPVATVSSVTAAIAPASQDAIIRAVERCDLGLMRSLGGSDSWFFRSGGTNSWSNVLSSDVVAIFEQLEPYRTDVATLGYSFANEETQLDRSVKRPTSKTRQIEHFDNGVPVPPIARRVYLMFDSTEARERWGPFAATGPGSFYAWMNAPIDEPQPPGDLVLTNLAAAIHGERLDLQQAFADLYGQDRAAYCFWFTQRARTEFALDPVFVAPIHAGVRAWGMQPCSPTQTGAEQAEQWASIPLPNLAAHIYDIRPDLQAVFPDRDGRDRAAYCSWFVHHGPRDYDLDPEVVELTRAKLPLWYRAEPVDRIARLVTRKRPDVAVRQAIRRLLTPS
jgi:hypothetical protein